MFVQLLGGTSRFYRFIVLFVLFVLFFYFFDFVSIQIPDRIKIIIRVFTLTQCVDYDIVLLIETKIESVTKSLQDIKKKGAMRKLF